MLDQRLNRGQAGGSRLEAGGEGAPGSVGLQPTAYSLQPVPTAICANPDRVAGAQHALAQQPQTDLFLLDDGFQHRRVARDFDLVLINALDPFGFGHVHPRGLLREPLSGLRRADAIVLTHADQAPVAALQTIERTIRRYNAQAPIYHANHIHSGLRTTAEAEATPLPLPLDQLRTRRFFAFSGIGHPDALDAQLRLLGTSYVGHHWLADHHHYVQNDIDQLNREAIAAGADLLLTTEKDWVKIAPLEWRRPGHLPIWRIELAIAFWEGEEEILLEQIHQRLANPLSGSPRASRCASG